jgi:hypothetical protein
VHLAALSLKEETTYLGDVEYADGSTSGRSDPPALVTLTDEAKSDE